MWILGIALFVEIHNHMEHENLNPNTNALPAGVSEEQLLDAVRKSGFPLQNRVQDVLRKGFPIVEPEWSYVDSDTSILRALDILAQNPLYDYSSHKRIRPWLSLLVECKQSELPYVFFKGPTPSNNSGFPRIAGLSSRDIQLVADDSLSTLTMPLLDALGVDEPQPVSSTLVYTSNLTKAVRKGKGFELTSQETFNEIVLPLVKSMRYFEETRRPRSTYYYYDAHILLGVCVLNAPMVSIEAPSDGPKLSLVPWVRVIRQEADLNRSEVRPWSDGSEIYAIDLVHEEFLESYLNQYVVPLADSLKNKFINHSEEIAEGHGHVSHLFVKSGTELLSELHPVAKTQKFIRIGRLFKNTVKLLLGKKDWD